MAKRKTYRELLLDPRWQKRRLECINMNITMAATEAHSSDRVSPITRAAALLSASGTPRGA